MLAVEEPDTSSPTTQEVPLCLSILPFAAPVVLTSDKSLRAPGIVGLFNITASPVVAAQLD